MTTETWRMSSDVARAAFGAHEAARQKGCSLDECLINYWAACFRAMELVESKAEEECEKIFGGDQPHLSSRSKASRAIQNLKALGVWPW